MISKSFEKITMDNASLKKKVKVTEALISISSEHEMQTVQRLRVDGEVVAMTGGVSTTRWKRLNSASAVPTSKN